MLNVGCLVFLTSFSLFAHASVPSTSPYVIKTGVGPKVDGVLDDEVWSQAPKISDFHQSRPEDHGEPTEKTDVQIARDTDNIYVAFRVHDGEMHKLVAKGLIQGQTFFSDDRVAITLDTFNDRRNSYFFQVNPNGVRRDALLGNDYFIEEWDTIWYAASKRYEWGWVAEMAIPLKSISFDPIKTTWGVNFTRNSPRRGENMAWSSLDRNIDPSAFGTISNMRGFTQGRGIELTPSLSIGYSDSREGESDTNIEPSLTGFYNITPNLTAGLTLNTDFSGTEVDERQINLGRFSLFFPEKRDFFLRDASIFEFGGLEDNARPFFSRRIGLSNAGTPLDLKTGVKLTGRAGDWNIGALAIRQDVVDPEFDDSLFVGRVTRNIGEESELGIVTTVGDPNADSDNQLFGVDYTYRNSQFLGDQQLRTNVWYQESDSNGFSDKQRAFGAMINYPNYKYSGFLDLRRVEENFNPALGFVNRAGVNQIEGQFRYRHRLENNYWQWLRGRFQYFRSERIGGDLQSENVTLNVMEGFSKENDFFTFFVSRQTEGLTDEFTLPGELLVPNGVYKSNRYGVFMETGEQRTWSGELEVVDGDFFGGTRLFIGSELEWKPSKHFLASVSYQKNDVKLPTGEFTSRLVSGRVNVAVNSKWAWLNLVQGDNVSNTVSVNSRIRYQPRADREFFLVFNQTRDTESDDTLDSSVILKAAFNFQL